MLNPTTTPPPGGDVHRHIAEVVQLTAAAERIRSRELLRNEADRLERRARFYAAEAERLGKIRAEILAKLAGQAP